MLHESLQLSHGWVKRFGSRTAKDHIRESDQAVQSLGGVRSIDNQQNPIQIRPSLKCRSHFVGLEVSTALIPERFQWNTKFARQTDAGVGKDANLFTDARES